MNEAELWLYLFAAFAVGMGLGWWLFAGSAPAGRSEESSAAVARQRAAPPPPPPDDPTAETPELTELQAALEAARTELESARAAASAAQHQRAAAEREVEAGRVRMATLQANLDRTRESRDTLRDEFDRARRTILQMEEAADTQRPNEALAFPPSRPSTKVPRAEPPPDELTEVDDGKPPMPPPPSEEPSLSTISLVPPPRIEPPPPPAVRPRGPVEVLFGPLAGVPLTTSARSIPWELTVRLNEAPDGPSRISDVQVRLRYDLEDEGVAVNGRRRGPLTLSRGASITPARPLHIQVSLSTGYHSDTPDADRPPAVPGEHRVVIIVQYQTDRSRTDPTTVRFSARIPVSAPNR
jgi:hypothetical protein